MRAVQSSRHPLCTKAKNLYLALLSDKRSRNSAPTVGYRLISEYRRYEKRRNLVGQLTGSQKSILLCWSFLHTFFNNLICLSTTKWTLNLRFKKMSDFNKYNIRQVGERIRLPGMSVSISEKLKDTGLLWHHRRTWLFNSIYRSGRIAKCKRFKAPPALAAPRQSLKDPSGLWITFQIFL